MSKFNSKGTRAAMPKSPMTTTEQTVNHAGGVGYVRDAKSELFQLAVVNMVGEDSFYESAQDRDGRFVNLVRQVAVEDPSWLFRFLGWLRNKANMRSASVVVAAEAVKARLDAGIHGTFETTMRFEKGDAPALVGSKDFIPQGMARADEPGEFMAYWTSKYGKNLPKPVRRGLDAAIQELFNEYAYSKYGKNSDPDTWGLADMLDIVHPGHKAPWQADLWEYALDERHGHVESIPESLVMLQKRAELTKSDLTPKERKALLATPEGRERVAAAGITFEALSGWVGGELDAAFWESVIPTMGYMALLRNLAKFDKAGISRAVARQVADRLADPEQVAKSRQFPYRFLSAYRAVNNDRWVTALSDALDASVGTLPKFPGRTLVVVDTSASMTQKVSGKSTVSCLDVGALFGVALASAGNEVDLIGFADGYFTHKLPKGASVLRQVESFTKRCGEVGYGTQTVATLRATYKGHDRVIIVTDGQAFSYGGQWGWGGMSVSEAVPADVPMFGINPAGYRTSALDLSQPNRYEIGGFSDQVFGMIGLLAEGKGGNWPF